MHSVVILVSNVKNRQTKQKKKKKIKAKPINSNNTTYFMISLAVTMYTRMSQAS